MRRKNVAPKTKKTLEAEKNLLPGGAGATCGTEAGDTAGGGLALVDRWRRQRRHRALSRFEAKQRNQFDQTQIEKLQRCARASDLTAGYKLDVGIRPNDDVKAGRNCWHTDAPQVGIRRPRPCPVMPPQNSMIRKALFGSRRAARRDAPVAGTATARLSGDPHQNEALLCSWRSSALGAAIDRSSLRRRKPSA